MCVCVCVSNTAQAHVRKAYYRWRYKATRNKIIRLQARTRGWLARRQLKHLKQEAEAAKRKARAAARFA